MDARRLQDLIARGLGVAARKTGQVYAVYRPVGSVRPLSAMNRGIEINAAFSPGLSDDARAAPYGQPFWRGLYDASYTQTGDYLKGGGDVYFVAVQKPGLPVQCVLTNRVVSLVRPQPAMQGGYSGFFAVSGEALLTEWPGSLREAGGHGGAARPDETRFGSWTLLLPALPVVPQVADVVSDDVGGAYVVGSAEQSAFGWRLLLRQTAA